ncbi:MAG: alpha/beta hydrolase [Actinomycetota bacterium]
MPVDPQLQGLVDAINAAAADAPPIEEQTVDERRQAYGALASLAGDGPDLPTIADEDIAGVPCRRYAGDDPSGCFVYIHGGGYTIGDLDTHDQVCRQLALESSTTVISVHYRLAPEHPFPAGIEDCWAVLEAIDADRGSFGADGGLVVGGDSAGGNFSAVLALMARDADLALDAQLLVYPAVDAADDSPSMTENGQGYVLTRETMDWFSAQYAADPADWRASPILADSHADLAPAVIITADLDPLRDQGARYADTLRGAGVDVTLTNYEGMVHVFFQLGPISSVAAQGVTQIAAAARTACDQSRTAATTQA